MKTPIGVIEGFFGPTWSWGDRHSFIDFLKGRENSFYIYAPKADPYLRKKWQENHPESEWNELQNLRAKCKKSGVHFGLGLSPFELSQGNKKENIKKLELKIKKLEELQPDLLGLFFDDMKAWPGLAESQKEAVSIVLDNSSTKLLFCPSYYSYDPILDKVFGQRPENYLEDISSLPSEVEIFWTGEKVISPEISASHLDEVSEILKRKPFVWDNYLANDGPKQCYYLKLIPPTGREHETLSHSAGWALNPMNQAHLSQIALEAFWAKEDRSIKEAAKKLCSPELSRLITNHADKMKTDGLHKMQDDTKLIESFNPFNEPAAIEITKWLKGEFLVDSECLTD